LNKQKVAYFERRSNSFDKVMVAPVGVPRTPFAGFIAAPALSTTPTQLEICAK